MGTDSKQQAAILVDYDHFAYFPQVQAWVAKKSKHAAVVALMTTDRELPDEHAELFDVVIRRNNPKMNDLAFKVAALAAVQSMSNLIPVVGIDPDYTVLMTYEDGGVLYASQAPLSPTPIDDGEW